MASEQRHPSLGIKVSREPATGILISRRVLERSAQGIHAGVRLPSMLLAVLSPPVTGPRVASPAIYPKDRWSKPCISVSRLHLLHSSIAANLPCNLARNPKQGLIWYLHLPAGSCVWWCRCSKESLQSPIDPTILALWKQCCGDERYSSQN